MNIKSIAIILLGEARGAWLWMTTERDARHVKREARAEMAKRQSEACRSDDSLDDRRFRQVPCPRCADAIANVQRMREAVDEVDTRRARWRSAYEAEYAERMRVAKDRDQAQKRAEEAEACIRRDTAEAERAELSYEMEREIVDLRARIEEIGGRLRDAEHERDQMRAEWVPRDAIEAALDVAMVDAAPTLAARVRLLAAARDEAWTDRDGWRNAAAADAKTRKAVEAERDELRASLELVRRSIGISPATDGIERIRALLGACEGETLVAAAERVMTGAKANAERLAQFDGYFLDRVRDL